MTTTYDFLRQLATHATGLDCDGTVAWLGQYMQDGCAAGASRALALRRACVHWQAVPDNLRTAIAAKLGIGYGNNNPWPVARAIQADYQDSYDYAMRALQEPC